jgi:hypothetical protein
VPKTFFKALFYNTALGRTLEKMSSSKSSPEGLKPSECERSSGRTKPPISYIPAAMDTPKVINKVKVSDKLTLSITVFDEGSPEQFLNHVQTSLEIISQRGLDTGFQEASTADLKAEEKLAAATAAKESYDGEDENPPVLKTWKKALAAKTRTSEAVESASQAIFMQYATQLSETARRPWSTIVGEQINCEPWVDVYGKEHPEKRPASWTSFLECIQLHLQTVFRTDAAEQERFYISNGLKKPNKVPIRDFVQRIQRLNGYLDLLPCLFYSSKAAKSTKVCGPFDDSDLASHILRMVPRNWQDQYELSGALVPQSVRELLEVLERIEKAYPTDKVGEGPKNAAKSSDSSKKKMVSFSDRIPKRRRTEKYCSLCKKHGGAHTTHNTPDCRKYESNGTLKKNFKGSKPNGPSRGTERPARGGSSHAQLSAKIDKLEKSNKKMKRAINKKKRKRHDPSDSDDSDSS